MEEMQIKNEIRDTGNAKATSNSEETANSESTAGEENEYEEASTLSGSSTSRKVKGETKNFSNYNKKHLLEHLQKYGCCPNEFKMALKSFKIGRDIAIEYLNKHLEGAQKHVHEECNAPIFKSNNEWLKLLEEKNLLDKSQDISYAIEQIFANETFPDQQELGGVDLKSIYRFLANATMGLPQAQLNAASASLLASELEVLMDRANSDTGDEDVQKMWEQLKSFKAAHSERSIDPLKLEKYPIK